MKIFDYINSRDIHFYGGLLVAGGGGAQISLPWTLVIIGGSLALYAVIAPRLVIK